MVVLAYFWKALALAIFASFMLSYLGLAQERTTQEMTNDALSWPSDWTTQDFSFSMLEPAAGTTPTQAATPTTAGLAAQTFRVEDFPRVTVAPSNTQPTALPAATGAGLLSPSVAGFRPISQAFGGSPRGVAANLGIVVNEQPVSGAQSGLAGLAAYGPLSGATPETLWLRAPQTEQQRRLQAATALPLKSPALQSAWRQILLANAAAPQAEATAPNWLAIRAEALEALGQHEAAWGLWREAGRLVNDPTTPGNLQQGWARASLLAGQTEGACTLIRAQAAQGMVSDFFFFSAAVCAASQGSGAADSANMAALGLAIQLLPASTLQADQALVAALGAVRDNTPPRLGGWPVGSLAGATLALVPQLLSSSQVSKLPDVAQRRILATPALSPELKRAAALALSANPNQPADAERWLALASSPTLPAPVASWPDAATLAWAKAYVQSSVNDPSATLPPNAAAQVVGAALRLQNLPMAQAWWGPYRAQTDLSANAIQARDHAYLALLLSQGAAVSGTLASTLSHLATQGPFNARTLAVVAGMGHPVAPELWAASQSAPVVTDTLNLAWQNLIMEAARQPDSVAVLAMITEALHGQNAASAPPAVLQSALAALRAVGLPQVALQLAAEALTLSPTAGPRVLKMTEPPTEPKTEALPPAAAPRGMGPAPTITPTVARPQVPVVQAPRVGSPTAPLLPKPKV